MTDASAAGPLAGRARFALFLDLRGTAGPQWRWGAARASRTAEPALDPRAHRGDHRDERAGLGVKPAARLPEEAHVMPIVSDRAVTRCVSASPIASRPAGSSPL